MCERCNPQNSARPSWPHVSCQCNKALGTVLRDLHEHASFRYNKNSPQNIAVSPHTMQWRSTCQSFTPLMFKSPLVGLCVRSYVFTHKQKITSTAFCLRGHRSDTVALEGERSAHFKLSTPPFNRRVVCLSLISDWFWSRGSCVIYDVTNRLHI